MLGELRVKYTDTDENFALPGRRAYLYAFRIRDGFRNRGYGTHLMKTVLDTLKDAGYSEFTVGVEDDNSVAKHMYAAQGFTEFVLRKEETYQGDTYSYNLYLKR